MKKKLLSLAVVSILVCGCNSSNVLNVDQMKEYLKDTSVEEVYPYYRVRGAIDYNDTFFEVDAEFTNQYIDKTIVPYARYHPGTYDPSLDPNDIDPSKILNFGNGSKAYWSHVPMRVNKDNFYDVIDDGNKSTLNASCSYSIILHYIKTWMDANSKNANTPGDMIMEKMENGGFAFSGASIHSKITIDNFPEYPDNYSNPRFAELDYDIDGPYPMYKNSIDALFNFRFEYNKDGWLTREYIASINYRKEASTDIHFYCEAVYTYDFGPSL